MSVRMYLMVAGASFVLGGTAIAADTGSSKSRADKTVCRRVTHVGSRVGETTCLKRSEWAALDRENSLRAGKTARDTEDRNSNYLNPERASSASPIGPN